MARLVRSLDILKREDPRGLVYIANGENLAKLAERKKARQHEGDEMVF